MRVSRIASFFLIVSLVAIVPALAQPSRGIDVAFQITALRLSDDATNTGIGGRLSVDLTRWLAVDTDVNFFPNDDITTALGSFSGPGGELVYHRRRTEGFAGVKVGHRGDRVGLFAKARPGFTQLTFKGVGCSGDPCALILVMRPEYETEFAFDLGGVVEFYPASRIVARFDLSDVIIRNRAFAAPPCSNCTTHNLTSRLGVGWRF